MGTHERVRLVWSPMPRGSGAIVVHRQLSEKIDGYEVRAFDPRLEYFPPALLALRNSDAPIVHATPDHGAFLAQENQRLVITFHNFVLDDEGMSNSSALQRIHYRTDLRWLTAAAIRRADVITAVSEFTAGKVRDFFDPDLPVHVIPNGIDTDKFSPAPARASGDNVKVLVCGNFSLRKGTQWLDAVAHLLPENVSINCTVEAPSLAAWNITAANINAIGKVSFDHMPELYARHDILFMPTVREGFGLAVAEAMSSGLPIVASRNSTMPELVQEGRGGFLTETGDVGAYAAALRTLVADPALRREMGEFNRQRILQKYRLGAMVESYRQLFLELT